MRHAKLQGILYDQFQTNPSAGQLADLAQEVP